MKLHFDPEKVEKLIRHTYNAKDHKVIYGNKASKKPGLWLVGDDGIYLMSNGIPSLPENKSTTSQFVVYADECNPKVQDVDEWWAVKERTFGPDDGCDFIDLSKINYDINAKLCNFAVLCTPSKLNVVFEQQEMEKPKPVKKQPAKRKRKNDN